MKRIKTGLVLVLLSLFLGSTTVTSYAQGNSATVDVGITFTEDPSGEAGAGEPSDSSVSHSNENTEDRLPQTGEQTSVLLMIIGFLCLSFLFYFVSKSKTKKV